MCGLVGILNFSRKKEDYNKEIFQMLNTIRHRGPDNTNMGYHKNYFYGFNRLSINDLSVNGNQPFENNKSITMANCEIYNSLQLKETLNIDSNKFNSNSDAEVIPFLYSKFDIDFLKQLDGMFALAIYDKNNDSFFLARDRLGIKPIYYYYDDNFFVFASEIKALLKLSFINKNINLKTLNNYLISGFGKSENTFINKIKIVPPGHFIQINQKKIIIKNYYSRPNKFINYNSENEILENFDNLLDNSVKSHLISDVPTSLMLSYGKDSNILRNKINQMNINNFKTFTLGFDNFKKNEIFMNNNQNHENFKINFNFFKNIEESFIESMDQPTVDGLNTYILTKLISKKGYRVVLSGLGADELLGGYRSFSFLPSIYKSNLNFHLITKMSYFYSYLANYQKSQKLKKLYNANNFENIYSVFRDYSLFEECKK
ncbi:asparagine synthase (glutamine-hydrolyzing), partial [Alphaproteobacteria bacterium]|nr:asparagine synthase (glutamine-hydrolyzing) [Alphaproteobacteria bacterium]